MPRGSRSLQACAPLLPLVALPLLLLGARPDVSTTGVVGITVAVLLAGLNPATSDHMPADVEEEFALGRQFLSKAEEETIAAAADAQHRNAAQWFARAASKGHAGAQYSLGLLYANGEGVDKSLDLAIEWVGKAAASGDENAKHTLELFVERRRKESAIAAGGGDGDGGDEGEQGVGTQPPAMLHGHGDSEL